MKALLETNILVDYLNGISEARTEIRRYGLPLICLVIWMEVLAVAGVEDDLAVRRFLGRFQYIGLDQALRGAQHSPSKAASDQASRCHHLGNGPR